MKAFAALAPLLALAAAEPEADPQLLLGSGLTYSGLPLATTTRLISPIATHSVISPLGSRIVAIGKREAEAEPEADPQLLLRSGLVGGLPLAHRVISPYSTLVSPYANRVVAIGKREAEAEPEADPQLLLRSGLIGGLPLARRVISPYSTLVSPYASRVVAIGKREAEAEPEADPQLLLRSGLIGGLPLTHRVISPYSTLVSPYASRVVAIGKREAEAEPEADPQLLLRSGLIGGGLVGGIAAPLTYTIPAIKPVEVEVNPIQYKTVEKEIEVPVTKIEYEIVPGKCVNNFGSAVPCRRKREAEADPALLLGATSYATPLAYSSLIHRPIVSSVVSPLGSRIVAIGKREAEAEADPQLLVSPYTLGAVAAPAVTYKAGEPIVKEIPITKLVPKVETKTIKITPAACQNYLGFPVPC